MKEKKEKMVVYVLGDINDSAYAGKKTLLDDDYMKLAFVHLLKETKKHNGVVDEMEIYDVEIKGEYLDDGISQIMPFPGEEIHTIELIEDISPNKPHKVLFKHPDFYGD